MSRRRAGRERPLSDLVGELAERADLRYGRRRAEAAGALEQAVAEVLGPAVAAQCRTGAAIGTIVAVECRTSAVAQRVSLAVPDILARAHELLENADLTSVRVVVDVEGW